MDVDHGTDARILSGSDVSASDANANESDSSANESDADVTLSASASPGDAPLVLRSAPNQTVYVRSSAPAGTEVRVTLRSTEFNFLQTGQTTVSADGTATATFDLTGVAPGTPFTATVSADAETEVEGVVVNASATVHPNATFVPSASDSNVTIRGRAVDDSLTKFDVRVAPAGETQPRERTVAVREDSTFSATFDLSSVPADTEVAVAVGDIPRSTTAVVVTGEGAPTVFAFAETPANATIRYPNETLLVHSSSGQTIHGTTNLRPGTELTVTAVNRERNSPRDFTRTANVTVGEDGTFAAELNFSEVEVGTDFSVVVGSGLASGPGRVVDESVTLPTVTTDEETTDTGVPGLGVPVALVALLAGLALARRD